jgi:hypothetical protein
MLTGLAGLAVLVPALAAPFMGHAKGYAPVNVPATVVADIAGSSFLIVGWIAAWRRPNSRIGLLMMAVGLVWFLGQVGWIPTALTWSLFNAVGNAWAPVLAHVFVSFPSGRLRARRDRLVVALAYGWWLAATLAGTLTWHPPNPPGNESWFHNVFGVLGSQHLNDQITRVNAVGTAVVVALVVGTMISHWRRATPPSRRVLVPVVWASVPTGVWFALEQLSNAGCWAAPRLAW